MTSLVQLRRGATYCLITCIIAVALPFVALWRLWVTLKWRVWSGRIYRIHHGRR